MADSHRIFGSVGALAAFPRRLAARAVSNRGGQLRRGLTRSTTHVVFGHGLLERAEEAEIERRVAEVRARGAKLMSENAFLRWLGRLAAPAPGQIVRQSMLDQSGIPAAALDHLSLFDAFEHEREPFSFRDLILCKQYAGLVAGGAGWRSIARAVHTAGPVTSLTARSLAALGPDRIVQRESGAIAELDGQRLLAFGPARDDAEDWFERAEMAEAEGRYREAADHYRRCLAADPNDSVAAFNRANCLKEAGEPDESGAAYALAIKLDPEFVEAWFNYAGLLRDQGKPEAARRHLARAIAIDPDYADAIYNLALLEYEAGRLSEARDLWARYLGFDSETRWARQASRGVALVDRLLHRSAV